MAQPNFGWRRSIDFLRDAMNPHTRVYQWWDKLLLISCLVSIFIDPLFFFLYSVDKGKKCIVLNSSPAFVIAAIRSMTDFIYLLNILLQFMLAYVLQSREAGAGDLVTQPKKIALLLDVYVALPLPQVMIFGVLQKYLGTSAANSARNPLCAAVLLQFMIKMLLIFSPFPAGQSASGFIVNSAWAKFVINLLIFLWVAHVVGSCWYLFGLQRVNQCLQNACGSSNVSGCGQFVDCVQGDIQKFSNSSDWLDWTNDPDAVNCLDMKSASFPYGIFQQAVLISYRHSIITRYVYSIFWGLQEKDQLGLGTSSMHIGCLEKPIPLRG